MRAALGAARGRLIRETLIEIGVLVLTGTLAGLAVAFWTTQFIVGFAPQDIPRIGEVAFDSRTLAYALVIALLTMLTVGLVPAIRVATSAAWSRLSQDSVAMSANPTRFAAGSALHPAVIAEVAMATVLLVAAGLLIKSFLTLINVDPGYDARRVLTFQLALPPERAADPGDLYRQTMARLASVPAVEAVGATDVLPIVGTGGFRFALEGLPFAAGTDHTMTMRIVSGNYFRAMGIRLIEGRAFADESSSGQPAQILVNNEFVQRYFGGKSPVGRIVGRRPSVYEVIGVVADVRHAGLHADPQPEYYVDFNTFTLAGSIRPYFVVRTHGVPIDLASTIRSIVRQIDSEAAVDFSLATMAQIVSSSVTRPRFHTVLFTAFAGTALILAAIGIYGVMTFSIARRTRELGIRMALGAHRVDVVSLVLRQGASMTSVGVLLGLFGAAAVTRYLEGMLFGLTPLDPATFVGVPLLLGAASVLASYLPARRATRVDPLVALGCE
jgi:putative ABC transport system permease protein